MKNFNYKICNTTFADNKDVLLTPRGPFPRPRPQSTQANAQSDPTIKITIKNCTSLHIKLIENNPK